MLYTATVADEACCGVHHRHEGDESDIERSTSAHHDTIHGPVLHASLSDIARAYGDICPFLGTRPIELQELHRWVAEVAVHLEDILVVTLQRPLEACDVGGTQSLLPRALEEVDLLGIFTLLVSDDRGSPVGRAVVDDQQMEGLRESHDGIDHLSDILTLIVGRDDDNAIAIHIQIKASALCYEGDNPKIRRLNTRQRYQDLSTTLGISGY